MRLKVKVIPPWIPMSKRMPEDFVRVLVYYPHLVNGRDLITVDYPIDGKFALQGNSFGQPTHWMPLPDKPKVTK